MSKEKYIVKHLAGSHAYGTNIATSDTDYRGIFMAEKKFILTPFFNIKEINDTTEEDTKFYELNNYLSLYLDGNPNILETLWVESNDILYSTEEYDLLRSHNKNLLSSKVAFTYSGYAHSQKTRMKNHYSWMDKERNGIKCLEELVLQYPCIQMKDWICESFPDYIYNKLDFGSCNKYIKTSIDFDKFMRNTSLQLISTLDLKQYYFVKLVHNYFDHQVLDRDFNIMNYNSGYELLPYGKDIYAVVKNENGKCINNDGSIHKMDTSKLSIDEIKQKPCLIVKFNSEEYQNSLNAKNSYHSWKTNRNPLRGEMEEIHGLDTKHAMHTVRLLIQCEELLTTGNLIVKRPDAQMLLDIREGKWSYDEIIEFFDDKDRYIREVLYPNSVLPKKPNINLASDVLIQLRELQWYNK